MADVERNWFRRSLLAEDAPPIFYGAAHPDGDDDGDFHPPPGATVDRRAARAAGSRSKSPTATSPPRRWTTSRRRDRDARYSLRWILVHMIEEYARHCGHADLLRQAVDGATGD